MRNSQFLIFGKGSLLCNLINEFRICCYSGGFHGIKESET
jgi:hypothetical protein